MEKKESKLFGLPFALVIFVVLLSIFIDGFIWFAVAVPVRELATRPSVTRVVEIAQPTVTPSATPSATVAPIRSFVAPTTSTPTVK